MTLAYHDPGSRVFKVASDYGARVFFEGFGEFERRLQVIPALAGWESLSFRVYVFRRGQTLAGESATDEMVMILLNGCLTLNTGGQSWELDGRQSVFEGCPQLLYLPPGCTYHLQMHSDCEVAYARVPAVGALKPRLIRPAEMRTELSEGGAVRVNYLLVGGDAEQLRCTEIITAWPADGPIQPEQLGAEDRAHKTERESVCYYRINPPNASGQQLIYSANGALAQTFPVQDGEAVIVRQSSQAFKSPPGARTYCLHIEAGSPSPGVARRDDHGEGS